MALLLLLLVPVVVWIGSSARARIAHVVTTLATWAIAALVEPWLLPNPLDHEALWRFYWIWLPIVVALIATACVMVLGGRRLSITVLAAWGGALLGTWLLEGGAMPAGEFWECVMDVSLPSVFASSFAVLACGMQSRPR